MASKKEGRAWIEAKRVALLLVLALVLPASVIDAQTIEIVEPGFVEVGRPVTIRATADGCSPDPLGWSWTATGDPAVVGAFRSEVTFTWIQNDEAPIVTASNSACGSASDSKQVVLFRKTLFQPFSVAKRPEGMIRGARETDSLTFVYVPSLLGGDSLIEFSGDPIPLELDSSAITVPAGSPTTISIRFPPEVVASATGDLLTTELVVTGPVLGTRMVVRRVPIRMLLADDPSSASPKSSARADFSRASDENEYEARITYSNEGPGPLHALVTSREAWIDVGDDPFLSLEPGESRELVFTIDRSNRPDAEAPLGSVTSEISLLFADSSSASRTTTASTAASLATTVTDTVAPPTAGLQIPTLSGDDVAFFLPGVGHVQGSVGLFVSDVSIGTTSDSGLLKNVRMYYLPAGGSEAVETVAPAVTPDVAVGLADVVKQTFGAEGQIGTLQLRTREPDNISAVATVFNSSNPAGTYGTTIPLFRSDRSVGAGESIYITGLRKTATAHTNLFLQEVTGKSATVQVTFLDSSGTELEIRLEALGPFGLLQRSDTAPAGSISVVVTPDTSSEGRVIAFATPVDRASGDTWTLTDWRRFYAYAGDEPTLVPVAGAVRGANGTYFRTDLAMMNAGPSASTATLEYFGRAGERASRTLTLTPGESRSLGDVVAGLFAVEGDSVGAIVVTVPEGSLVVTTSRTYTTVEGSSATFGTGVPTLSLSDALQPGEIRRFGGLEDATFATIAAGRPASFRTNFGLVETAGTVARIRATVKVALQASMLSTSATLVQGSKEYQLAPNQLLLLSNVAREILGEERESTLGDLRNLQVEFEMLEGRAHVFVTSTDNGTGDSILRTE